MVNFNARLADAPEAEDIALDPVETRTLGSRVIYERHRRARDASD